MNWRIQLDLLGRGWYCGNGRSELLYRDGSLATNAIEPGSCFWPTARAAARAALRMVSGSVTIVRSFGGFDDYGVTFERVR